MTPVQDQAEAPSSHLVLERLSYAWDTQCWTQVLIVNPVEKTQTVLFAPVLFSENSQMSV